MASSFGVEHETVNLAVVGSIRANRLTSDLDQGSRSLLPPSFAFEASAEEKTARAAPMRPRRCGYRLAVKPEPGFYGASTSGAHRGACGARPELQGAQAAARVIVVARGPANPFGHWPKCIFEVF